MALAFLELLAQQGSTQSGSFLTVDELFRESYERAGVSGSSLTDEHIRTAKSSANFMLNGWCSRTSFSWMRRRRFLNLTPYQFCYPVPQGTRNLESVILTHGVSITGSDTTLGSVMVSPDLQRGPDYSDLFVGRSFQAIPLGLAAAEGEIWVGWQSPVPRAVSYVGVLPKAPCVLNMAIDYQLHEGMPWQTLMVCPPTLYPLEPVCWHTIEHPIRACHWRVRFLRSPQSSSPLIHQDVAVSLRHIFLMSMPETTEWHMGSLNGENVNVSRGFQGIPADRSLGEIACSNWMSTPQKMQGTSQPTSFWFDSTKSPSINIWPVPTPLGSSDGVGMFSLATALKTGAPPVMPGLLYTSYSPPRDIHELFQFFDVPAVFVDAMAAELGYRLCLKMKPEDQVRLQKLESEATRAFKEAAGADAEAAGFDINISPNFSNLKIGGV